MAQLWASDHAVERWVERFPEYDLPTSVSNAKPITPAALRKYRRMDGSFVRACPVSRYLFDPNINAVFVVGGGYDGCGIVTVYEVKKAEKTKKWVET